jgi:hypothetical protein
LHPAPFRSKFEDQMLWIFDESVESRGAASLLLDAFVSLARQWVLRPGHWRPAPPSIAIDGTTALLEQLRRNAEALHRRAWRLNAIWMVCGFGIYFLLPMSSHWNPIVVIVLVTACFTYGRDRLGQHRPEAGTLSIGSWVDPRTRYRKELEGKRDGLRSWNGRITIKKVNFFGGGVLALLVVLNVVLLAKLHNRPYLHIDRVRLWGASAGVVILAVYWLYMKRCNERAAKAIQQAIDAMDELPTSRPV